MKTPKERKCSIPECDKTFFSVKGLYCSKECRKIGSLQNRITTNISKYGVENAYQSEEIKKKIKITNLKKYGVENPMQNTEINAKAHNTIMEKYNTYHALQNLDLKNKMKETMVKKYGAASSLQSDILKEKIYETNEIKYGNKHYPIAHIETENYELLNDKKWLSDQNNTKSVAEIMKFLGVKQTVVNKKYREFGIIPKRFNSSKFEIEVEEFLKSMKIDYIRHDKKILLGKELDFYIPEYKLALECNGTYWHSELNGKNNKYHLEKTIKCKENDISLFHIWEHEWGVKKDIIKSMLKSRFNKLSVIYARKCEIKRVPVYEEKIFLEKNHLQGYVPSSICFGLYYNSELVSLMSFGTSRFSKDTELLRFCNKVDIINIGAGSKLFFTYKKIYNPGTIISYSHRDKFNGNFYTKLGFIFSHSSPPSYYYTKDHFLIENRMKYQKHKLHKLLPIFDENKTEWENMQTNGYDRIWDCGNDVWVYKMETI